MPTITANNTQFYYELYGKGEPLILIAGYTCDHYIWLPLLHALSQHFQVLIFDNRAVGQTKDNSEVLSAELMAKDVMALAHELGLQKPHIVGQSMGGTIAQIIGSQFSNEISKLVIITSSAKWRAAMLQGQKVLLDMRKKDLNFDLIFEGVISWVFGEKVLQDPENVKNLKQLILENPYPQSLENQMRQFHVLEAFDGREHLKNIHVPTLVVHGKQDVITLGYESEYLAENIPHAKLVHVDSAHGIVTEQPKLLAELLVEFCAVIPRLCPGDDKQ